MMHNLWRMEDNVISTNEQCGVCTNSSTHQYQAWYVKMATTFVCEDGHHEEGVGGGWFLYM